MGVQQKIELVPAPRSVAVPDRPIPVLRPLLPRAEAYLALLREVDENRWYSNHGPLLRRFEGRIAAHFGIPAQGISAVANGTVALTAALHALGARPKQRCLLPSWTFIASAAAVLAAGLVPHFVDVDRDSWALDPDALARRKDLAGVGAVMAVSPFGAPLERARWENFTARTGIPVLIDAAAGFDSVSSVPSAGPGPTPIMISLHATKVLGVGEGAVLLSSDRSFIQVAEQYANFGFYAAAEAMVPGINGKLSEYAAAVGLAALEEWPARRARMMALSEAYRAALAELPHIRLAPAFGEGWVGSTCCVLLPGDGLTVGERLALQGVETRRWWRRGCHHQPAYGAFPRDALPVTEDLARRCLGLPFYPDLTQAEIARIAECLALSCRD
jgi:dTDP-4-amino-4,6-dideoxygalactose transaminase